jgi:hypothetical protein
MAAIEREHEGPGTFELVVSDSEEEIARRWVTVVPGQEATISLDLSGD